MKELTNAEVIKAFADIPRQVIEDFGEEGDLVRTYLILTRKSGSAATFVPPLSSL